MNSYIFMVDLNLKSWSLSSSLNYTVQLHANTSQFLYCIQQHYGCIVAIACKIFDSDWSVAIATGKEL